MSTSPIIYVQDLNQPDKTSFDITNTSNATEAITRIGELYDKEHMHSELSEYGCDFGWCQHHNPGMNVPDILKRLGGVFEKTSEHWGTWTIPVDECRKHVLAAAKSKKAVADFVIARIEAGLPLHVSNPEDADSVSKIADHSAVNKIENSFGREVFVELSTKNGQGCYEHVGNLWYRGAVSGEDVVLAVLTGAAGSYHY